MTIRAVAMAVLAAAVLAGCGTEDLEPALPACTGAAFEEATATHRYCEWACDRAACTDPLMPCCFCVWTLAGDRWSEPSCVGAAPGMP